jgi:hypothetical protein
MGRKVGPVHIADIALGVIAFAIVVYVMLPLFEDRRAPVIYHGAYYAGEVYPGAVGEIRYYGKRIRHCESHINDFWVLPSGKRLNVYDGPGNWTEIGEFEAPVAVTIPDAGPGLYVYRSRIIHTCADGIHDQTHPPDVLVVVVQ